MHNIKEDFTATYVKIFTNYLQIIACLITFDITLPSCNFFI